MDIKNKMTVVDIFCGAGGFSEGFRQLGYKIALGIDNWAPAINTYNHNFNLNCSVKNVLDYGENVSEIESLIDTDVIIGSPPCVSFSNSNKSGKADKSLGVKLTEIFLRIVAVKKFKRESKLKFWLMENVPNSLKYVKDVYTFEDLDLVEWATSNEIEPSTTAFDLKSNRIIINSADYGTPQIRKRALTGEYIKSKKLLIPNITHGILSSTANVKKYVTLDDIKNRLGSPYETANKKRIRDPNYPNIILDSIELSDHFYDTGIYLAEWEHTKYLKVNHPFMGKMSFPEDESKPSRTITATRITTSREALIYRSESGNIGDGEYRLPTIREIASLMGFPISYQFLGSLGAKTRLVGNAVCPCVSRAFANVLIKKQEILEKNELNLNLCPNLIGVNNLNSYTRKTYNGLRPRLKNSRFRRHPFKDGNMTVTLSNYDLENNVQNNSRWYTSIQYGTGNGFYCANILDNKYVSFEKIIRFQKKGPKFLEIINNGFSSKLISGVELQDKYESRKFHNQKLGPIELVEEIIRIINRLNIQEEKFIQESHEIFLNKSIVPLKQLFALYAINRITSFANRK